MTTKFQKLIERWEFFKSLSVKHWRYLFRQLNNTELNFILVWLVIAISAALFLSGYDYWALRVAVPSSGGSYTEGLVGKPLYLNPLLSSTSEADRDITTLIFSGLVKHDEHGKIVPDLAESYIIKNDGRTYEFTLKENLNWPDKKPFTSDDVVFTLNLIKDANYPSSLRSNWQGIKIEKIDERKLAIKLPVAYEPFLENATVGILPQHIWSQIKPQNFLLTQLNIKPIGLGKYQLKKITKNAGGAIKSIVLSPNPDYPEKANISNLTVRFYEDQESLLNAYKRHEIDGFSLSSAMEVEEIRKNSELYNLKSPRYFGIFFNQTKSKVLEDLNVRKALAYSTDKNKIVSEVLKNEAQAQIGPFSLGTLAIDPPKEKYNFNIDKANVVLDQAGWKFPKNGNFREKKLKGEKTATTLEFNLTTTDWPELTQVASILKSNWEKVGVKVNLDIVPVDAIQSQNIRTRAYEALLFGEVLSLDPDPFSFWHSTQRKDPGLNLSLYSNKRVDSLLESARQTFQPTERIKKYEEFQNIIMQDLPAIFLYSPNYIYAVSNKVKGINIEAVSTPSQRFENINNWYIATKRVKK